MVTCHSSREQIWQQDTVRTNTVTVTFSQHDGLWSLVFVPVKNTKVAEYEVLYKSRQHVFSTISDCWMSDINIYFLTYSLTLPFYDCSVTGWNCILFSNDWHLSCHRAGLDLVEVFWWHPCLSLIFPTWPENFNLSSKTSSVHIKCSKHCWYDGDSRSLTRAPVSPVLHETGKGSAAIC